jgi:hypothetical protein
MKILIINFCGKVGKTVVAAHMLKPRMNGARICAVESINESVDSFGLEVEKFKGRQFGSLFDELISSDSAIIDVGSSNSESFIAGLSNYEGSVDEIDLIIVPATNEHRVQRETMKTVKALNHADFDAQKIRILFNRVQDDVAYEFHPLIDYAKSSKLCIANPAAAIYETDLFDELTIENLAIDVLLNDTTDYRSMARDREIDMEKRQFYAHRHVLRSLARGVDRQLDTAYSALFT